MNDTDVQAKNTDCKPKLHKNYKLVLQYDWFITMLFQGQQRCWSRNMLYLVKSGSAGGLFPTDTVKWACVSSTRYVSAMTTPSHLSPVGLLSPVTPSSPPSEMSAPLSSLATSVPSMAASPSGEEERPLLFRTPPILRDKTTSNQSGHNLRNSAHYNHGLELPSPLHTVEQEKSSQQNPSTPAAYDPNSSITQPSVPTAPEPVSSSNSETSSSESEAEDERVGEDTLFLVLQSPLATGSVVLDGLEGSRTNPALHLSLTAVMINQDLIAVWKMHWRKNHH